jgi:hypothetical protein
MIIKFPPAQRQLGIIQRVLHRARQAWAPQEVDESRLVSLDRARESIRDHVRRADQAYAEFATLPRVA